MSYRQNPAESVQRLVQEIETKHDQAIPFLIQDEEQELTAEERMVEFFSWINPEEQGAFFNLLFGQLENQAFERSFLQILRDLAPAVIAALKATHQERIKPKRPANLRDTGKFTAVAAD